MQTIAGTINQVGGNTIYGTAPFMVVIGPEHAQTIHRDGWTIPDMQEKIYEDSAVHISRVSRENRENLERDWSQVRKNDHYYLCRSPDDVQILVAGGPGKHSAYIPTFGFTEACSVRIANV